MNRITRGSGSDRWRLCPSLAWLLIISIGALPAAAKTAADFDPSLDFSKFETFAYIGGVEQLLRMQLNPEMLKNRIHRSVTRELTSRGLREVQPEESPDLVVRYWVETETDARVTGSINWGTYGNYYWGHWTVMYTTMDTHSNHRGTMCIELINQRTRDLAWRLFISEKIIHVDPDKIWKTTDNNIKKGFKSYPPSAKDITEKKQEWAKVDTAGKPSQP